MNNFFKSQELKGVIGKENFDIINKTIKKSVEVGLNLNNAPTLKQEIVVNEAIGFARKIGVTQALAGIYQYPKQYVGAFMHNAVRLGNGKSVGYLFEAMAIKDKDNIELLNTVSVGTREGFQGGVKARGEKLTSYEQYASFGKGKKALRIFKDFEAKAEKIFFWGLRKGDANIAKSAWLAHFKDHLGQPRGD